MKWLGTLINKVSQPFDWDFRGFWLIAFHIRIMEYNPHDITSCCTNNTLYFNFCQLIFFHNCKSDNSIYFITILTILFGIMIVFTISLPSIYLLTFSFSKAFSLIDSSASSAETRILARSFPFI